MTATALMKHHLAEGWRWRIQGTNESADSCWPWPGRINRTGYGLTSFGRDHEQLAHRLSYRIFVAEIPAGFTIDHLCRNRRCVNPKHLEAVTPRENILRGDGMAARRARQTHCKNGHPLSADNVYTPPSKPTKRECRVCRAEYSRDRWLASKA